MAAAGFVKLATVETSLLQAERRDFLKVFEVYALFTLVWQVLSSESRVLRKRNFQHAQRTSFFFFSPLVHAASSAKDDLC